MKKIFLILGLMISFAQANARQEWNPGDAKNQASIKNLFSAQLEALDGFTADNNKPDSFNLTTIMVDYGLTHDGMLGLLPYKGTAAATGFWSAPKANIAAVAKPAEMMLSTKMSYDEIMAQGDYYAEVLSKTKKIKDTKKLKTEMHKLLEEFYVVAYALSQQYHPGWRPTRLYFDRSVTVGGMLIEKFFASALFRFRVMWDLSANAKATAPMEVIEKGNKLIPDLEKLVTELADDLHFAATELPKDQRTSVKSFTVGLGITDEFDLVGIVNAKNSAMGIIDFDYFPDETVQPDLVKSMGSPIKMMNNSGGWTNIDKENMKKGLAQAFKMASLFFNIGQSVSSANWKLGRIDVSFDMSEKGDGFISRVNSDASSTVTFARR